MNKYSNKSEDWLQDELIKREIFFEKLTSMQEIQEEIRLYEEETDLLELREGKKLVEKSLDSAIEFLLGQIKETTSSIEQLKLEKQRIKETIRKKKNDLNSKLEIEKRRKIVKQRDKALLQSAEKDKEIENLKTQIRTFSKEIEQEFSKLQNTN
ncbi:MAG: hypothetical protein GKR88_13005 [Flavobacteriaceae bacterium]|nr:MAG: hypothetical protein GKR88_13005 [Flavobacteriaceae bacterium]